MGWFGFGRGKNTGNKDAQSKKSWEKSGNVPDNQSKQKTQLDRLTAKYGEGFRDTTQGKDLQSYLDGVSVNRGGNRGADDKAYYNTGDTEADEYRKRLGKKSSYPGYQPSREEKIKGIDTVLARRGLKDNDYFKYGQFLREQDPAAYDKARPWSSGANIWNIASKIVPGAGMFSGIFNVANKFGKGTKNLFNQAKTGITNSGVYNDLKDMITIEGKQPTVNNMGTRKSNIDYDDASNPRGINMADISGPSTSTDIIEIKDNKVKTKDNIDKVNNAQKTLTEAIDVQNFKRTLVNPSAIETLPVNFKSTLDKLLQNNQLNSSEILRSQQLLRDFSNEYNNSGITNTLPTNQIAGGFNTGLEYLLNNEAIEKRSNPTGVNLNTLGQIQEGIGTIDNYLNKNNIDLNNIGLNNNIGQGLTSGYNAIKSTQDGKGFDVDINNRRLEYNKDFLGGKINTYIEPENVGIGWSTSIG